MQGAVGFSVCIKLQICPEILQWKKIWNQFRFDRIMAESVTTFLAHPVATELGC